MTRFWLGATNTSYLQAGTWTRQCNEHYPGDGKEKEMTMTLIGMALIFGLLLSAIVRKNQLAAIQLPISRRCGMNRKTLIRLFAGMLVLMGLLAPRASHAQGGMCFAETGKCIDPSFVAFWQGNGGLPIFGFPISEPRMETNSSGDTVLSQWFERNRFELHSGNQVLLGRLGAEQYERLSAQGAWVQPSPADANRIASILQADVNRRPNNLMTIGYPVSGVVHYSGLWVRFYERARVELHTEQRPGNLSGGSEVLYGLLGREELELRSAPVSPAPAPSGDRCKLDKIATFAEVGGAGPQRQEIGGGGVQHADFYPDKGVNAVSYIVPVGEPGIWHGYGSIWEGNGPECQSFDWIADTTRYAQGRLNNGHSGLVIDLRQGGKVVANVGNLGQSQIDELLGRHRASQQGVGSAQPTPPPSGGSGGNCPPAQAQVLQMGDHEIRGPAIANLWSNAPGVDQTERKYIIHGNENPWKLGPVGGTLYVYASSCSPEQLKAEYAKNPLPEGTWQMLHDQGLAR